MIPREGAVRERGGAIIVNRSATLGDIAGEGGGAGELPDAVSVVPDEGVVGAGVPERLLSRDEIMERKSL